ncbi:MAG: FtsQ-type POTRA domain-containing protein [Eubacteriales bacterium]|nr:FtsQ-type POTRA domain-containing protein [Eubacteriales bacterium]
MDYVSRMTPDGRTVRVKNYKKRIKRNRRRRKILFFSFLLLCLILFLRLSPIFRIKEIVCVNNSVVPTEEIVLASSINYGENIFAANVKRAKDFIEQIPYIDTVKISRKIPNIIKFEITESEVYGYVPLDEGYIYIDENCKILEYSESVPEKTVPMITGSGVENFAAGEILQPDFQEKNEMICDAIKAITDNKALESFTSIDVSEVDKLTLFYKENLEVYIGKTEDIDYKINLTLRTINDKLGPNPKGYLNMSNPKTGANYREVK